ncbi:retrovirus-related pol polyprotein from transposon TNT 1-94 [Tanacetum coccineum]
MIYSQMDDMIKEKIVLKKKIDSLEQNCSNQIREKESLLQTFTVFKNESKEKENKYIDKEIDLEKKIKELDNIVYKVGQSAQTVHMLTRPQVFYDNAHKQAIDKHVLKSVFIDEETLILEEEQANILWGIFEQAKAKQPIDNALDLAYLKVAFRKSICYIQNLEGVDLLLGSRDTNLYTISLDDMLKTSPICLLSKASKTKSWLWHHRLSHLNFGKGKKSSHQPKAEDTNQEKLYLFHMNLCGPMRVESINGKKYILVIVDDYSRFTCVRFLRSKDEAPDAIIKCIKKIKFV